LGTTSLIGGAGSISSVTNNIPARGGKNQDSINEIREKTKAFFTTQNRAVTKEDYEARVMNIPPKFGNIAKVYVSRTDPTNDTPLTSGGTIVEGLQTGLDNIDINLTSIETSVGGISTSIETFDIFQDDTETITVGFYMKGFGQYPKMDLKIHSIGGEWRDEVYTITEDFQLSNGPPINTITIASDYEVTNIDYEWHYFDLEIYKIYPQHRFMVEFTNDGTDSNDVNINLYIDKIKIGDTEIDTFSPLGGITIVYDTAMNNGWAGDSDAGYNVYGIREDGGMPWDGIMLFSVPTTYFTDTYQSRESLSNAVNTLISNLQLNVININDKIDDATSTIDNIDTVDITNLNRSFGTINIHVLSYDNNKNLVGNPHYSSLETTDNVPLLLTQNIKNYLSEYKILTDVVNIQDGYIINFGVLFDVVAHKFANKQEVKLLCIEKIKEYFNIDKMQFGQPIFVSQLEYELMGIDGVRSVNFVKISQEDSDVDANGFNPPLYSYSFDDSAPENDSSNTQSGYGWKYDFTDTSDGIGSSQNGIILPANPNNPAVFELKNPNQNIKGVVR